MPRIRSTRASASTTERSLRPAAGRKTPRPCVRSSTRSPPKSPQPSASSRRRSRPKARRRCSDRCSSRWRQCSSGSKPASRWARSRRASSYGLDPRETRMWVALHQTAHRIEFEALSGVGAHFFALFHNYVAALDVDLSGAFERLQSLDITSPDRLREAMEEQGFFGLLDTPATQQALNRVQRFL